MSPATTAQSIYMVLVRRIADDFPRCDGVRASDIRALTDSELAVICNHEDTLLGDATFPGHKFTEILDSAVHTSPAERTAALGRLLREGITQACREYIASSVTTELNKRAEA